MTNINQILGTSRNGANHAILAGAFLSQYGDWSIYVFLFKRKALASAPLDVIFSEAHGAWTGIRLTGRGKRILRDQTPNRYLAQVSLAELEQYRLPGETELGHALERWLCDRYNGQVLPAADDAKCRDVRLKIGKTWLIAQVKKFDDPENKGVVANAKV